ncbi:MAG TPA: sigma-70 family RNA polymerase sigma factor [Pedococcus sp.]|nr:sigma-70 family RNA polymerase sigma factor [Pedococcus sp.]
MTELLSGVETPSDAELISRVRGGDVAAYGELFSRHVDAAHRLGRQLVRGPDADDLVSEAFAKTLQVLQSGGGPDVAFRAYLLTSVRRLHVDRIRSAKRVQPSDDMTQYDDGLPFQDTAVASFENGAAAKAFSSLPERWQLVLWHLEVEGQKPADIAPLLGMSANSVSALAYRAREGLRQAFLTMHLADCSTEDCRWVNQHLGGYVRKGLSRRDTAKVEEHLDHCRRCTAMYLELDDVNSNLAGIIAPLLLGAAAAGYLSSGGVVGATGLSALFGRVRDAFGANSAGSGAGSSGAAGTTGGAGSTGAAGVTGGTATAGGTATTGGAVAGSGAAAATTGAVTTGAAITTGGLVTAGGVVAAGVAAVATAALVLGGGGEPSEVVAQAEKPVGIVQTPPGAASEDEPDGRTGSSREAATDGSAAERSDEGSADGSGELVVVARIESDESGTSPEAAPPAEQPGTSSGQPGSEPGQGGDAAPPPAQGPDSGPEPQPAPAPQPEPKPEPKPEPEEDPGTGITLPPPFDDILPPIEVPGTDPGTATPPVGDESGGETNVGEIGGDAGNTSGETGGNVGAEPGGDTDTPGGDPANPDENGGSDPGSSEEPDDTGGTGEEGGATSPSVTAVLSGDQGQGRASQTLTVTVTDAPGGRFDLEFLVDDQNASGSIRFTSAPETCSYTDSKASCPSPDAPLVFEVHVPPGQAESLPLLLKVTFPDGPVTDEPPEIGWDQDGSSIGGAPRR